MEPPELSASTSSVSTASRRQLKSRNSRWAAAAAGWLARWGVSPNAISIASVGFSVVAAACYAGTRVTPAAWTRTALFIAAAAAIQCRLLCNLLDGMVAVEWGKGSRSGEIYNDLPDRLADPIILCAVGYAAGGPYGPPLGWAAAVGALLTAYVRVLGRSVGAGTYFIGPMAKQHRMALVTAASLVAAVATHRARHDEVFLAVLAVVVVGCVATVVRRLRRIVSDLEGTRA